MHQSRTKGWGIFDIFSVFTRTYFQHWVIRLKIDQRFKTEIPNMRSFTHGKSYSLKDNWRFWENSKFHVGWIPVQNKHQKTQDQVQGTLNNDLTKQSFYEPKSNYIEDEDTTVWMFFSVAPQAFFYKQPFFFNSASVLLNFYMNWATNVTYLLLNTYNHYHTEARFIITIFVSMSRPRSIYVVSMWSIFLFHLHFYYD